MDEIKTFLINEQSTTSDDNVHPKIVGNYILNIKDVSNQIIDWTLHYLENRKCPYQLALAIAKRTAKQMETGISEQLENKGLDEEKILNSVTLYSETLKMLPSVCNYFLEHSKEEEICSSSCSFPYAASVFAIKNKRRKMEDRHVIHHDLNLLLDLKDVPTHSYYAVFDGHSGVDAASYASAHLHVNIAKHPAFLTDTPTAIAEAYKITDESFLKKCSEENLKSGSTAVCALIRENKLYISWLGDSQAVLVKEGKPVIVTDPHTPNRPDEKKRIEAVGGTVSHMGVWRVNGILAVTRALGDPDHKQYISSEPEVIAIDLDGTEDFLILACDGLWDGMSPEDVTSALYYNLSGSALDEPLDAVSAKLVHQSKIQGSEDNITTIVVFLRDIKTIKDYAAGLLPQACSQINFLEMNGEGKASVENTPCTKPTILELNAASTKKLKNAANVLNSAGFSCPCPESVFDEMSFQNTSVDYATFVPHQNVASFLAPEATALSELPTPPIDDVLASQQFEKLCSADLYQGLNAISSEQCSSAPVVEGDASILSPRISASNVGMQPFCAQEPIPIDLPAEKSVNEITPDEAVDIASSVVSNTIETAVKCLSSGVGYESVTPVSAIKLNPYAKPFIPGETQLQNGSSVAIKSETASIFAYHLEEQSASENDTSQANLLQDHSFENILNVTPDNLIYEKVDKSDFVSVPQNASLTILRDEKESNTSLVTVLTSEFSDLTLNSPQCLAKDDFIDNSNFIQQDAVCEKSIHSEIIDEINVFEVGSVRSEFDLIPSECTDQTIESNQAIPNLDHEVVDLASESPKIELTEECLVPEKLPLDKQVSGDYFGETTCEPEKNIVNPEATLTLEKQDVINAVCINDPGSEINQNDLHQEIQSTNLVSENPEDGLLKEKTASPDKIIDAGIALEKVPLPCLEINQNESDQKIHSTNLFVNENPEAIVKEKTTSPDKIIDAGIALENVPLTCPEINQNDLHQEIQSINLVNENSENNLKETSLNLIIDSGVALENDSLTSLVIAGMKEELISASAVLPSDLADEGPVDLHTVPDGIPEAEGVTEDIDSDSEKDGGWSYMKVNTTGSGKPKSADLASPKVGKTTNKVETNSKLKKDVSKTISDGKNKFKNITSMDKTKKPLEKRATDVKEKIKTTTRTLPSTLPKAPVEKTSKATLPLSRVRKDLPASTSVSKVAAVATTKSSRPTILRNPVPLSKPGAPSNKERSQAGSVKPIGNVAVGGNIRPKSALSNPEAKTTMRPGTASTLLSKAQPPNQSNKANLASSTRSTTLNRLVASTVPSRALTKPSTLSKSALESKTKQPLATVRKTELKKPDVKETKDIVNKQISARRNVTLDTHSRNETVKSATNCNKRVMTLSNKPIPFKTRAPVKNDVSKKDVPKPVSKFAAKTSTPLKTSEILTKGNDKKTLSTQNKLEKKIAMTAEGEQSPVKVAPVCEEEKFILEANDKEVIVKEQNEVAVNSNLKVHSLENGIAESIQPLEEILPPASAVSESLL